MIGNISSINISLQGPFKFIAMCLDIYRRYGDVFWLCKDSSSTTEDAFLSEHCRWASRKAVKRTQWWHQGWSSQFYVILLNRIHQNSVLGGNCTRGDAANYHQTDFVIQQRSGCISVLRNWTQCLNKTRVRGWISIDRHHNVPQCGKQESYLDLFFKCHFLNPINFSKHKAWMECRIWTLHWNKALFEITFQFAYFGMMTIITSGCMLAKIHPHFKQYKVLSKCTWCC